MKNTISSRKQLCDYFSAFGKSLASKLPELDHAPVISISGDDGCGKSIISDHIINGSITVDSRTLAAHYHAQSYMNMGTLSLEEDDLKYFDEYVEYDAVERVYELWTGEAEENGNNLRVFFCNSAMLPKDQGKDVVGSLMRLPQGNNLALDAASLPDNIYSIYHGEKPRDNLDRVADLILVTNPSGVNLKPDLMIELTYCDDEDFSWNRNIKLDFSEESPLYDHMIETHKENEHLLS